MPRFPPNHHKASKLSPVQVAEIRALYASREWTQAALSRHFRITIGQIGRIVRGEAWQAQEAPRDQHQLQAEYLERSGGALAPEPTAEEVQASEARLERLLNIPEPERIDPVELLNRHRPSNPDKPASEMLAELETKND